MTNFLKSGKIALEGHFSSPEICEFAIRTKKGKSEGQ
jgi:hypothetical protein